ncbi:hypothetical protein SLA2020_441460 [Shorea laevis]
MLIRTFEKSRRVRADKGLSLAPGGVAVVLLLLSPCVPDSALSGKLHKSAIIILAASLASVSFNSATMSAVTFSFFLKWKS